MADKVILEVSDLKKSFDQGKDKFEALKGISFALKKGEILGFLGPNGAGKTTTIQILLGVISPTSGKVKIFSKDLGHKREEILQDMNFSSAYVSLPFKLTVWENLLIFATLYNVKNKHQKIMDCLELFQINDLKDRVVSSLSAGQTTRVSFAKALLNDPKILLLDEPMASLDPYSAQNARDYLKKIQKQRQLSILYTSHNMQEVERMCDRIIFLHKGKIVANGTPIDVTKKVLKSNHTEPDLEKVFIEIAKDEASS